MSDSCKECKGKGHIQLLTSSVVCKECGGTGKISNNIFEVLARVQPMPERFHEALGLPSISPPFREINPKDLEETGKIFARPGFPDVEDLKKLPPSADTCGVFACPYPKAMGSEYCVHHVRPYEDSR